MTEKKINGSYYTPSILSDFLIKHIFEKYIRINEIDLLEPSCGDGQFISSLESYLTFANDRNPNIKLSLVELNGAELNKAIQIANKLINTKISIYNEDFLEFILREKDNQKYSLIIGNPPYIKKESLKKDQIERCEVIRQKSNESSNIIYPKRSIKNIWPAFVEGTINKLNKNGILCFVLPSELLQVNYTQDLRNLLLSEFDRIEIFAFNELIFEGIQQDVIALIGVKGLPREEHGVSFYQVEKLEDLKEPKFTEKYSNIHRKSLNKWTNYLLTDEELDFIDATKENFHSIKYHCKKVEAGIVTAANEYFILNQKNVITNKLNRLKKVVKPILPKGSVISDTIYFDEMDFERIKLSNERVNFISFPNVSKNKLGKIANSYIDSGEILEKEGGPEYQSRYKMKKRTNWYSVPNIWKSEGLFIKRSHLYPKIFVNNSNALATDSFYRIIVNDEFDIKKLIFSFYNSLTLLLAELEGRFYGGGVLELTPNEFKNLRIPYNENISEKMFYTLEGMFRSKISIENILNYTDPILLSNLSNEKILNFRSIRNRLLNRRLKVKIEIEDIRNIAINNEVYYSQLLGQLKSNY
ncbi:MAG: SAM-dependent methyltransferase [Bacteroidales bacterium]|nr:SAM-dependent methyltransferase [Bacteroidales bacterium]MCF8403778.1 SAM-dependent methyltransferase [Bacteroidales bacterium]